MAEMTRQEQILKAATKVFADEGYHRAKVEDIALEAGVGKGTVYEYFESKRHLFNEVMGRVLDMFVDGALEELRGEKDSREKFKAFILYHSNFFSNNEYISKLLVRSTCEIREDMLDRLINFRERVLLIIGDIIDEGIKEGIFRKVDPHYAAILFLGVMLEVGNMLHAGVRVGEDGVDKMLDYFLYGLAT